MGIRVCVAGATGWAGGLLTKTILDSTDFRLVSAIARVQEGADVGIALGLGNSGIKITSDLETALKEKPDVIVDFTKPDSVKQRTLSALASGVRIVIGTSGLSAKDYEDISEVASKNKLGVVACGNFSITAALAKRFSMIAAQHLPSWEIIDYAHADKVDAPSGTTRELAEELAKIKQNRLERALNDTTGIKEARGASIAGTQVHSIRLPSFVISFETIFGQPHERLSIRHDSGVGAEPYVKGTLMAVQRVMKINGLVRGLDNLLFGPLEE